MNGNGEKADAGVPLRGQTALVTGGARGLGRAIAETLAERGAAVAVHYRCSGAEAREVVEVIMARGGTAWVVPGDVTRPDDVESIFRAVEERTGRLDVLVNNVGDYLFKPLLETRPEEWTGVFESNLKSCLLCCRRAAPMMRRQGYGRIVNVGFASAGAPMAKLHNTAYHIAKMGVVMLSRALAVELAPHGVTVNVVSPGVMENSLSRPVEYVPAGRAGRAAEVAEVAAFLAGRAAGYVTGADIPVSGGWNI